MSDSNPMKNQDKLKYQILEYIRSIKMFFSVVISSAELLKEEEARIITVAFTCSVSPGNGPL